MSIRIMTAVGALSVLTTGTAMAQVSGCPILDVLGDAAVTVGVLGCDREAGERLLLTAVSTPNYECIDYGTYENVGDDFGYQVFECTPY